MARATGNPKEHIPVTFTTDLSHLPQHVRDAFSHLQDASAEIDKLYLASHGQDLKAQNGIFDNTKTPRVWPENFTKEELRDYLAKNPEQGDEILSPFTVVSRGEAEKLVTTPYTETYKEFLLPAATHLGAAAYLLHEYPKFQHFLKTRAKSFRDGSFFESDIAWVHATDGPIELIIGPMEAYEDTLRNIKRSFESLLCFVPPDAEHELGRFQASVRPYDEMLGMRYSYHAKSALTPMRVVDLVALAGEAQYRYMTMACNLPNNPEIQHEVGSKKTFFRQVIDAKLNHLITPIIHRVFHEHVQLTPSGENYLHRTLGHELAHGLTFRFDGEDFADFAMPLEESKADVFGCLFLYFLETHGAIRHGDADHSAMVHIADLVRQVRFDLEDAHAIGALLQWNWLEHEGAISVEDDKILISKSRLEEAYQNLGDAFYKLSVGKDETEAQDFLRTWGTVPTSLRTVITLLGDIPVDIDPHIRVVVPCT